MMNMKNSIVITTINSKTKAISEFERSLKEWELILVGDRKSVFIDSSERIKFYSIDEQERLNLSLTGQCPENHYSRKNIGYLIALKGGAQLVYDTDDDNLPYDFWGFPNFKGNFNTISEGRYCNIYNFFSSERVWPRGFPLREVPFLREHQERPKDNSVAAWQGLADLDPDVDAIYRLIFSKEIKFNRRPPIVLGKGVYCPFNSQNTLWEREMMPYAYLPSTVTFRFTDIIRGYIAQRCFWEHNKFLGFTEATVYQERNNHDLLKDFESEIPCYLQVEKVVAVLDNLKLRNDYEFNLLEVYRTLIKNNFVHEKELDILKAWLKDVNSLL